MYIFKDCFFFWEFFFFLCVCGCFFFSFRLIFNNFSKIVFSSLLLFLSGKNLVLFFTMDSSVSFLFLNFSICLNFLSNSFRSFFFLFFSVAFWLSKFIWSLFNLCVDKSIILGLTFVSFFILFFSLIRFVFFF